MFVEDSKNCGIYCWTNKVNDKKYIGQSDDLHRRYSAFLYFNNTYSGDLINKARIKYNSADYWNYEVLEYCTKEELNEKEIMYIYLFNTTDRRLGYNLTSGGNRPIFTAEAKAQMSRSRGIPIYQINKDTNEIIREWEQANLAAEELNISTKTLRNICKRKTKVSNYGIILRYKKDYVPGEVFQMKRIIEQIDENGEIVKHWVNAKQAAKDLNINITTLYRYLNGQIKHSRLNLILRYKDK